MTAVQNLPAGARLTAALLQGIAPLAAYKGVDESVTSSTTLQNDDALFVALAANATYFFIVMVLYEGGTLASSDMKITAVAPSGSSLNWTLTGYSPSSLSSLTLFTGAGTTHALGTNGAGNKLWAIMAGTVANSVTAGNLQVEWAQNTSNATATIVHAGSSIQAWQIA